MKNQLNVVLLWTILCFTIHWYNMCWHRHRSTIRDKIIPHAVSWFTGEALQGEDFEDEDEEVDDDDEDDEDDEDEDDSDDDDEEDEDEEEVRGRNKV